MSMTSWHVGVAAEAFAAGQFARLGWDVSVQYGADQPGYDLVVKRAGVSPLTVSVKGSKDGSWGLSQKYLRSNSESISSPPDYKKAADLWYEHHREVDLFLFVQFRGVDLDALPSFYVASPMEVRDRLKIAVNGRGDTILHENHTYMRGFAVGMTWSDPHLFVEGLLIVS